MEEHKKKELYYTYNEKFAPSHCCATQKLYLLDVDAAIEPHEESFEDVIKEIEEE